ncbi:MAG: exo-alpha-sialidase [Armatimonadota bacterium]
MRALTALLTVAIAAGSAAAQQTIPFSGDELPESAIDTSGYWVCEDGVLRQTDTSAHPALIFFPEHVFSDFEMQVEFRISPTSTSIRAPDLLFRARDTANFYYFHIDTTNEMVAFARSKDGEFWTEANRARDNPVSLGEWHHARVVGEGDTFTIWIDGEQKHSVSHSALEAGCLGLGTASAEVAYRNLTVSGTPATLPEEFGRGPARQVRPARHRGPGQPAFSPSLARLDDRLLLAYCTAVDEGEGTAGGGEIMLIESIDDGRNWSEPRAIVESGAREPSLSVLPGGRLLLAYQDAAGDVKLLASEDSGTSFSPAGTLSLPDATLRCRQAAIVDREDHILLPLVASREDGAGVLVARSDDASDWELGGVRWRQAEEAGTVARGSDGDLLLVTGPEMDLYRSDDGGETWRRTRRYLGPGHDPVFFRAADGTLLLAYRKEPIGLHVMRCLDDTQELWQGPIIVGHNVAPGGIGMADLQDDRVAVAYTSSGPSAVTCGVAELDHPQIMPGFFGARSQWPEAREGIVAPTWDGNPRNGEGSIARLNDGSFLLSYTRFYSGGSDHSAADISGMRSYDGGRTWEGPFQMHPNDGGCTVMSVSLLRLQSGRLMWGYLRKDTQTSLCRMFVRTSSDEGESWSPEVCATPQPAYHVVNNDRIKQLSSGRLLVPAAVIDDWAGGFNEMGLQVFYSDDEGETWQTSGQVLHLERSAQEPAVIELEDGRVLMICRTHLGRIYQCHSSDGGETFTELEPTEVIAPCSPCSIRRIPSTGDLLLIFSDSDTSARVPHASMISRDEGRTWENLRHIEPTGRSYCYTSICFWDEMSILSYYDFSGPGSGLKVRRLPQSWYYGPQVSPEESVNVRHMMGLDQ